MFPFWRLSLGVSFAILVILFVTLGFSTERAHAPADAPPALIGVDTPSQASSTPTVVIERPTVTEEKPNVEPPKQVAVEVQKPEVETGVARILQTFSSQATTASSTSLSLNEYVRAAVVNILCITDTGGALNSISGSGVIIDSRGIILTNAHVAQYFLLKDHPRPGFVECTVRTGSPAQPKYKAELVFYPPSWIQKNANKIKDEKPMGNGEHDYAFLRITGTVHPNIPMPASFPFLQVSIDPPALGDTSLIAGYPAGFLGGITIQKDLYQASSYATIGELYTFETSTIDVFSIGGSIVAQQGSSGGAAANENGVLVGIIVTSTDAPDTASRDLRALSTAYIVRNFESEFGSSLSNFLSRDMATEAAFFAAHTAPALTAQLVAALESTAP